MKVLPFTATEEMLFSAVEEWVSLLEQDKYQDALDFIYPIPFPEWTAD
ncbi:hypothetical protein ACRN9C_21680 [Shewanella frigidimarina]